MQHAEPPIQLSFIEAQMYEAIRQATPEQQAELHALAASQSLAAFTRTLQTRYPAYAQYITEPRVEHVLAYDRWYQASGAAPVSPGPTAEQSQLASVPASQPAPARISDQPGVLPAKQSDGQKHDWKYHLWRSTWLSAAWNWCMMFAAAACEAILTISVIYSCARLLPALQTPIWLDNTVFIWQMVALDVGGLSLRKMANQARKDGNEAGATFAGRVSTALITIMILNVVLSILQGVAHLDEHFVAVIEGTLLVARAVMAVLYAAVIHSLREEEPSEPTAPAVPALDVHQQIAHAVADLQTTFEQRLAEIAAEQSRMLASIQQVQAAAPTIDQQAIIAAVVAQVETRLTTAMKRLESDMKRVSVSPVPETGQSETAIAGPKLVPLPQRSTSSRSVKQPAVERETAQASQPDTSEALDCKSAVYALLDQDNTRQVADLARVTGYPKTTVWRHWNRYHEEHGTRGQARIVESETAPSAERETAS
jgi:uncharacterized membrane protein